MRQSFSRNLWQSLAASRDGETAARWGSKLWGLLKVPLLVVLCTLLVHFAPIQPWLAGHEALPQPQPPTAAPPHAWEVESLPGKVFLGGGTFIDAMGEEFVRLAGGPQARLVIIPTAYGGTQEEGPAQFIADWMKFHPASVEVLDTHDPAVANDPNFVAPLCRATGVWLTGGKQYRLLDAYEHTLVQEELHRVLERGGVVGGNCAGAMALGELTILRGKEPVSVRPGLGIVPKLVMDSHLLERNRLERLRSVIGDHPDHFGLGIDHQTAAIIEHGHVRFIGLSYAATLVPVATPEAVRIDMWDKSDDVELDSLFHPDPDD